MKNYLKKIAVAGIITIATGVYTGGSFVNENTDNIKEKYEKYEASRLEIILKDKREEIFKDKIKNQSSDEIILPSYKLPPEYCSKYARLSAKKIFNKKYIPGHAWDLKYDNKIVYQFKEEETINDSTTYENLKNLIIDGILKPGMMVVVKRQMKPNEYLAYKSYNRAGRDKKGNKIEDTHVLLYLGLNDNGEEEFAHYWYNKKEKIIPDKFKERKNLKPTLILDEPDKSTSVN